jgi:hypothetical protein
MLFSAAGRQTKIRQLDVASSIQENVVRLDVAIQTV